MRNDKSNAGKFFGISIIIVAFLASTVCGQGADSSQKKDTDNKADRNLKSVARVNPSTLAMEFNIPMMSYPGRSGNSLPFGLSYSSKIWRMSEGATYWYQLPYSCTRQYVTQINPRFAERSAAGWTSSLSFPVIEEKQEIYNEEGNPYSVGIDEGLFNDFVQNSINEAIENGGTNNLLYACGMNCTGGWRYQGCDPNGNCSPPICQGWSLIWCDDGDGGGGGGGCPPPTGGGGGTPPPMYHVKRVRVRMGDGSTHEFRKSDVIYEGNNDSNLGVFLAVDGSGMKLERTFGGSTLFLPDGSRYLFPAASTGSYDRATLFQSNEFIDANGNRSTFSTTPNSNNAVSISTEGRKLTDTMGREFFEPLPQNLFSQQQIEGTQEIYLPSMDGKEPQKYELEWQHLKPVPCTPTNTTNCGNTEGALENQSQNAFYYTSQFCFGSYYGNLLVNPNNINDPANEVLFPMNGLGIRSCNPFTGDTPTTAAGARFNPVVLGKVKLPNGKYYIFKYNQYGEISKIIYPTGSYETFTYDAVPPVGSESGQAYDQTNRGVKERRVYSADGTLEQRWQYFVSTESNQYKVTTIAPKGNDPLGTGIKTERYLYETSGLERFGFQDPLAGMPYEEKTFDENNVLRSRSLTEYAVKSNPTILPGFPNSMNALRDPRVKRTVSVAIENGLALATLNETQYNETGTSGNNAQTDAEYFSHLDVKRAKGYHYAVLDLNTAQNGALAQIAAYFNQNLLASVSETDYVYDANYKTRGIRSLPTETRVLNPSNLEIVAKTQTIYDNAIPAASSNYPTSYSIENYGIGATFSCPQGAQSVTCWSAPGSSALGRVTTKRLWDDDNEVWIETHTRYDIFGNAIKVKNAVGNEAETIFENTPQKPYLYAYPTKVITPAPDPTDTTGTNQTSVAETTYDLITGLVTEAKNDFGQITKTEYDDDLLRPTRVYALNFTAPETQTVYNDNELWVKVRKQIDEQNWDEATVFSDSLGRTVKTQATDSQGDVFTETEYDFLGRVKRTTNPYRSGDVKLWSKPRYDEMSRTVESFAPAPDGQTGDSLGITTYGISTAESYTGTFVLTTDAAGKQSRAISNALGQLIRVDEPDHAGAILALPQSTPNPSPTPTPSGPPDIPPPTCLDQCLTNTEYPSYATVYRYNEQGKMVEVIQGEQHRYFKYDSLGRLIRVRQPEQETNDSLDMNDAYNTSGKWTAGFSYDLMGNVLTATDANGTVITNTYDKANRITTKTYSNEPNGQTTPAIQYLYDGFMELSQPPTASPNFAKGKLTKVTSSVSETRYTQFDYLGRLLQMEQRTPFTGETLANATPRVSSYQYDFSGRLIQETYPSGRIVKNEFEADGDLSRIYGKANPNAIERTYANGFSYTPDGKIQRLRLGNGRWESAKFNNRLQVTELALGASDGDGSLWKLAYEYGELNANGTVDTTKNTGNIAKQTLSFNGLTNPLVQTFKYDSLYRLTEARETSGSNQTWKESFTYDRFGNRTGKEKFVGTTQISNDNKTHPTIDPLTNRFNQNQGYVYDKNGNLITDAESRSFVFNGENKQYEIKDTNNQVVGRYFYDGEGKRVKKVTATEETVFVYSAGKLVAEYSTAAPPENPTTKWTATDQLGSPRVITDSLGNVVSRRDFLPFGEEAINNTGERSTNLKYGTTDGVRQKFIGYQKDDETGLDFAEARMYENRHGRFTAVDPLLASGKSANPQTFNRYVYVTNSPLIITDPTGLCGEKNRQPCPANHYGTVYTKVKKDGFRYFNNENLDGSWDVFTGEPVTAVREDTKVRTTFNKYGWFEVPVQEGNDTVQALLGSFNRTLDSIGSGSLTGASNVPINYYNDAVGSFFSQTRLDYFFNPPLIQKNGYNDDVGRKWGTAIEGGGAVIPLIFGGVLGSSSALPSLANPFKSAPNTAVFYRGRGVTPIAKATAELKGQTTIQMTQGGRLLDKITNTPIFGKTFANRFRRTNEKLWDWASGCFAKSASGSCTLIEAPKANPAGTWIRIEQPALRQNPNVTNIQRYFVDQ